MFGARVSPLTGSPRLAATPPNAILNYLYALLESEARLAAAALGLDPGLGVLHVDTSAFGVTDPFYQWAYVWAKEEQWEPLWNDVVGLDSFETATRLWLKNKLKSIT